MEYNFVAIEENILEKWNNNKIFKKSLEKNKDNQKFIFYDGPPFATGSPHYGHILAGAIKDSICRHAQMKGFYVERRAGWDCIVGDTNISLSDGTSMKIKDLKNNLTNVISYNSNEEYISLKEKVTKFFDQGEKECIKLYFDNNTTLTCTKNHKIMTDDGYICADDISIKNTNVFASLRNPLKIAYDIVKNWNLKTNYLCFSDHNFLEKERASAFARILGYVLTNGYLFYNKSKKLYMSYIYLSHKIDAELFIEDIYKICNFKQKFRLSKNVYCINLPRRLVYTLINLEGMPIGKRVEINTQIPTFLLNKECPLFIKQEFLGGLFGGNGHAPYIVRYPNDNYVFRYTRFTQSKVKILSNNLKMYITDIVNLLKEFDISVSFTKERETTNSKNHKTEKVKLGIIIKKKSMIDFANKINFRYCIHKSIRLDNCRNFLEMKKATGLYTCNEWLKISNTFDNLKLKYSINRNSKKIPYYTTRLIKKEDVGMKQVYDLCVPNTSSFIANGIVIHNCHGLPIEYEIEKNLGIKNYDEIIKFGIENYNNECRKIVMRCAEEWKDTIGRFGRWIDFENDYKTMDVSYMESIWWCFRQMWDKNLVYQGFRVMPYSTACGTPLSNFEAKSNYKLVTEESVIVKFKDIESNINYLVWTTTPWTLPSNMALCVNANIEYSLVEFEDSQYILATSLIAEVFSSGKKKKIPKELKVIETFIGSEMENKNYKPIFNYYNEDHVYKICCDNYVSESSGTGIVHIAPAFGEDDFRVCVKNNVVESTGQGIRCPVDRNGCYIYPVEDFIGRNVKDCDKELIEKIKQNDLLFKRINTSHDYPFCWRSDTPLIYKAVSSWFVHVTAIKEKLIENNLKTNWVPDFIKTKRFNNWLEEVKDWGISRSRFWGTPIPIWTNGTENYCVGSIEELEVLAGLDKGTIKDLHRETIDNIEITSPKTGNKLKRIEDVFDCWFESGCMPFAYQHYPFESELSFPADFIAEGLDQTRGWFYTLLVISTAIKEMPAFNNVIVNGLVLAEDGKKMSKRLKNYPDPIEVINEHGADCLRMYLLGSPVVKSEPLRFKEIGVTEISRSILIPLTNSFTFYNEHKTSYELQNKTKFNLNNFNSENVFDRWIQYKLDLFRKTLFSELDNYKLYNTTKIITEFIENLNNRYIKLNRNRLKGKEECETSLATLGKEECETSLATLGKESSLATLGKEECETSLATLGKCIFDLSITLTSLLPFFSENMYTLIKNDLNIDSESVHLLSYKDFMIGDYIHLEEFDNIDKLFEIIDIVRTIRGKNLINYKMPIEDIIVCSNNENLEQSINNIIDYLKNESNILNVTFRDISIMTKIIITPNKSAIGKEFQKKSKEILSYISKLDEIYLLNNYKNMKITLDKEFLLNETHFNVIRGINQIENYVELINDSNDLLVYVNLNQSNDIMLQYLSNVMATSIQKFRKEINLKPWDKISINFITKSQIFIDAFEKYNQHIFDLVRNPVSINKEIENNQFDETIVEHNDDKFKIQIYRMS